MITLITLLLISMGNQACCQDQSQSNNSIEMIQSEYVVKPSQKEGKEVGGSAQKLDSPRSYEYPSYLPLSNKKDEKIIVPPDLFPYVKATLDQHQFFREQLALIKPTVKEFAGDVYEGEIDEIERRPNGWGKMYKSDGSLFIGEFVHGKAEGKGAYIFPDGSYYLGWFVNNAANCKEGLFQSETRKYKGGFKDNAFQGYGKENADAYDFEGVYSGGKRFKGSLQWTVKDFTVVYIGTFNEKEQFHGHGTLVEELGTYEGDFVNGIKDGKGEYVATNGVRYVGDYRGDKKEGEGVLYNYDNSICYKGEFKNGLPHGKGTSFTKGKEHVAIWNEGIDTSILQQKQKE